MELSIILFSISLLFIGGLFGKPFKETGFGKFLWKAGDTLKGKTKTGKVLDSILEIAPIPNPIRMTRDITTQSKLSKLKNNQHVKNAAREAGFEFDELLDDAPSWTLPVLASVLLIGIIVLIAMGVVSPQFIIDIIAAIAGGQ